MTKRKTVAYVYFAIVASVAGLLAYKMTQLVEEKKAVSLKVSVLPDLSLYNFDSTSFDFKSSEKPVVIVIFNSTCENCKYEAMALKKSIHEFSDVFVLMLSSEPIRTIKQFSEQVGLTDYKNIKFAKIGTEHLHRTFGVIALPHILLYGCDQKLVRRFQGTIEPKEILDYL